MSVTGESMCAKYGDQSLPRKSVVRLTDRSDMTSDVYRGRKTTSQQQQKQISLYTESVRDKQQFFFDTMNICSTPNSPNIMQTDS